MGGDKRSLFNPSHKLLYPSHSLFLQGISSTYIKNPLEIPPLNSREVEYMLLVQNHLDHFITSSYGWIFQSTKIGLMKIDLECVRRLVAAL